MPNRRGFADIAFPGISPGLLLFGLALGVVSAPLHGQDLPPLLPPIDLAAEVADASPEEQEPAAPSTAQPRVPDDASQADARQKIRDMFRDEYAKTATADMVALAQSLRDQATAAKPGSVDRFVLLREAIDLALKGKDASLALDSTLALAKEYDMPEGMAFRLKVYRDAAKVAKTEKAQRLTALACLQLASELAAEDRIDDAMNVVALARNLTMRGKDSVLKANIKAQNNELQRLKLEMSRIQPFLKKLAENPEDPAANLAVGRHCCLQREDWAKGLPYLARSGGTWASAAQQAMVAANAPQWLAAADAWWDIADAEKDATAKAALARQAAELYRLAQPNLEGLDQAKAAKRIADIERQFSANSPALKSNLAKDAVLVMDFENVRGKHIPDLSGCGNHGRSRGKLTFRPGIVGQAAAFDGVEAAIVIADHPSLHLAENLSIAFWIFPDNLEVRQNPYNKCYGAEGTITLETGGSLNLFFGQAGINGEPYMAAGSGKAVPLQQWTHCVVVRDQRKQQCSWYINGEPASSIAIPAEFATLKASSLDLILGSGYANAFTGMMDEVIVWNRALSDQDVKQLFKFGSAGQSLQ